MQGKQRGYVVDYIGLTENLTNALTLYAAADACMMAPLKIIDYIVVHELCHLHQRNHSDIFWNEVDKVMPDYAERKEWLRKHRASLTL